MGVNCLTSYTLEDMFVLRGQLSVSYAGAGIGLMRLHSGLRTAPPTILIEKFV